MDYVLWGLSPVPKVTDQGNLLYVLTAVALRPNSPWYILTNVHRWAIYFSLFGLIIEHIDETGNVSTDLLTRESKGYRLKKSVCGCVAAVYKSSIPKTEKVRAPLKYELTVAQRKEKLSKETLLN